jgi:hypothetical protein
MLIEEALGKQPRRPFDWCITDKGGLLAGLKTGGASFLHDSENSELIYRAGREGVASAGIYFWHDYPKSDRTTLCRDWRAATPKVNEKYCFLWERFLDELSEPGEIVFVLATTQDNLIEFASGVCDFKKRFALNGNFIDELAAALEAICSDPFSILVLVRSLEEADEIRTQSKFARLLLRFCGPLQLKVNEPVADLIQSSGSSDRHLPVGLAGCYDNGAVIESHWHDADRILRPSGSHMEPWGECYALNHDRIFISLKDQKDGVLTALFDGLHLKFSSGEYWTKI